MKWPRRPPSTATARDFFARHALFFGYATFSLVAFLAALLVTFPHEEVARSLLTEATREGDTRADFRRLDFSPPLAWMAHDVVIVPDRESELAIRLDRLRASPAWTSLVIPGRLPALDLDVDLWNGSAVIAAGSDGKEFTLDLEATGIDLAEATDGMLPGAGRLGGRADLALEASGDIKGRDLAGEVVLLVQGIALRELTLSGFQLPDLDLSDASLRATLEGNTIRIAEFLARGKGLRLRATGTIQRNRRFDRSTLDLRVEIEITDAAPSSLRGLRMLLPKRKAGESFYQLRGTIRRPKLS